MGSVLVSFRDQFLVAFDKLYMSERNKLLERLGEAMKQAAQTMNQKITSSKCDSDGGFYDVDIDSKYFARRLQEEDEKHSAGYSVASR
jgi:hypothetical protein